MRVKDRMSTTLFTIAPESRLADAFDIMTKQKIRHLPILDRGKLIGMITSWQIYSAMPSASASEYQQRD
ncbi:MAG: CBS domain-containing protein, partial [Acidobacteriota bacterium]